MSTAASASWSVTGAASQIDLADVAPVVQGLAEIAVQESLHVLHVLDVVGAVEAALVADELDARLAGGLPGQVRWPRRPAPA